MSAASIAPHTHLRAAPGTLTRLVAFIAASMALHVATLATYVPAGTTAAPPGGPAEPQVLHATLTPREALLPSPETADDPARAQQAPDGAGANARAGRPDGVDTPLPDKWYEASELEVRAEPLTYIPLVYPEALLGTGITGRVRVLLFIDERGVVRKAQIAASNPEGVFDKAAIQAWQEVRFSPARKQGTAVKSRKLLELEYRPN